MYKSIGNSTSFALLIIFFFSIEARAQSFCFLSAATYYEQVYCELQAKGEARGLPPFHQFKRNDENIQAVLLKRPAARVGIDLPMPKKNSSLPATTSSPAPQLLPPSTPSTIAAKQSGDVTASHHSLGICTLAEDFINCIETRYRLTGNRLNHRLSTNALTEDNKMALPAFSGNTADAQAVNSYLTEAYRRYIEKMHDIGLAGATMTYGKFSFLFYDLHEKGLDFSQRFETMYGFLKKDKASMGVSEKLVPDQHLQLPDCDPLSDKLVVCSRAGRNYLYVAVSD